MNVDRRVVELCVKNSDGIDEFATFMVGWDVVCAKSAWVLNFDLNTANPVDEGIDCLDNLRACRCGVNGENKVTRVVIFGKNVVLVNRKMTVVDGMAKARQFIP